MKPRLDTTFLNVDLEIKAGAGRELLIEELSRRMVQLRRPKAEAAFETLALTKTLDATLRALIRIVGKLGPEASRAWRGATRRDFNIGIQSTSSSKTEELTIERSTLDQIVKLGGRVVITVYTPSRGTREGRQPTRSRGA